MTRVAEAWMRGAGPMAILKLLGRCEMYGYELAEALDRESAGVLAMGHSTLYPLLYNLESKELIERHDRRAEDTSRVRKYYRVTAAGRAWLRQRQAEWAGLVEAMDRLGLA